MNTQPNTTYPAYKAQHMVHCSAHGLVPGYVVCSCVLLFAEPVAHVEPPKPNSLGEILCKRLGNHAKGTDGAYEFRLICTHCATSLGITKIGGRRAR